MNHALRVTLSTSVLLCGFTLAAPCQLTDSKYEVGINGGIFIYQGDLTPSPAGSFRTPSFAAGINGSRKLNKKMAIRLDLTLGRLRGSDASYPSPEWRQQRDFEFRSSITEVTGTLIWNTTRAGSKLTPYLTAGLGVSFVTIVRDASGFNPDYFPNENIAENIALDFARPLPEVILVLPVGIGLKYVLTEHLYLYTEAAYRNMSTDYLDGFSKSANPRLKDHYYKYSVGLTYSFAGRNNYGCPVIPY